MAYEDIAVVYPTGYDSASTIMGIAENRQTFTLNGGISVSGTSLTVDGTAGGDDYDLTDLDLPCLLVFAGGEIWFIDDGDVTSATELSINFSQRAKLGTSVQIHADDEKVHAYFSGKQHEMLRDILINMEKFPIVQGEQPSTPTIVGEAYIDSNYDIYVSFDGIAFTKLVSGHHDNLDDVPTGAATTVHGDQYMHGENTTFTDWHDGLSGVHIEDGDDHTHLVDGTSGEAFERIANGTVALPTGEKIGQIYLLSGELYFIYDSGLAFEEFFGIPSGSILPFPPASGCPAGWSAYSALNNSAYARVKTGGLAGTGGSNTHTHTVSEIEAHVHTILEDTCTSSSDGDHSHYFWVGDTSGTIRVITQSTSLASSQTAAYTTTSHSHTGGTQAASSTSGLTSGVMSASFVTDSGSTEPEYKTMKWCKKD